MVGEWRRYKVDQLKADAPASIAIGPFGSRMKSDTYVASGIPVIRGNNISATKEFVDDFVFITEEFADELKSQNVREGDLVFPHRGNIGAVGIVGNAYPRYMLSTSLMKLTCDRAIADPLFLFYFFRSPLGRHKLLEHASTVGTPGIGSPLTSLRSIEFEMPPLKEQQAIACILGSLDDKIELSHRMNRTLEQMAAAIFKAWFVDFEPVKAKAAGAKRFPAMPQAVFDALPARFADSPLGPIPKKWKSRTVSDIGQLNDWTLNKQDELEQIEYVEISEVMRGEINKISLYERGAEPSRARRRLRHGDTVMSTVRPDRGAYFLCLNPSPSLIASTGFVTISPAAVPWSFVHAAMSRNEVLEELGRLADGGAYPAVRPEIVGKLELAVPDSADITAAFHELTGPLYERADLNRRESKTLAAIRDALLPKLLSGEIRIKTAEKMIEEFA